jgi:hypothetical protein
MKKEVKLVTVARFEDYMKADLARQLLEDEGIRAFVLGQNVGNVYSRAGRHRYRLTAGARWSVEILKPAGRVRSWRGPGFRRRRAGLDDGQTCRANRGDYRVNPDIGPSICCCIWSARRK